MRSCLNGKAVHVLAEAHVPSSLAEDEEEIKACFDYKPMLVHVDEIFARFGL